MNTDNPKAVSTVLEVVRLPNRLLRRLYDWTLHWARTRYARVALFIVAFAESSFFPIPPDVLMIAMTVADRYRWWLLATITTVGSVLGGVLGYYIGVFLYESVGQSIIQFYHLESAFEAVRIRYEENAFLAVFAAAFTPIPYKVFTIAGGVFHIPLYELIFGSVLGRGGRFFIVAALLRVFGERISATIEKYFDILSLAFLVLLIGGFLLIRFLT